MAVINEKATQRRSTTDRSGGKGEAYNIHVLCSTIELGTADSTSTIDFGRVPSNARILSSSRLYNDDLTSNASITMDIGLKAVDGNITTDPDALGNGYDISDARDDVLVLSDAANAGLPAWDFVANQTSDPGGEFIVQAEIMDGDTSITATVTLELYYYLD